MTNEYIRKSDAVEALVELRVNSLDAEKGLLILSGIAAASDIIESLEPADVAPVRHGTWLPIVSYNNTYKCSECGRLLVNITDGLNMVAKHYPYCHCGAKMDGEECGHVV